MDVLTVEHLTKKIGNKTILKDISLNLKRGQIVGLVGANGAGKTSLMKVILGYSIYQEGNFEVIENKHKKSNVGALIENPGVYPFMSGYDNLKLLNETKNTQDIDTIVSQLKMDEYIHNKAKTYSLGMKQKLGIAIAFLNQPHSMSRSNFTKVGKVGANLNAINVRRVRSSLMFYQKEKKPLLITNKRTPFFQCSLRWLLEGFQSVVLVIF